MAFKTLGRGWRLESDSSIPVLAYRSIRMVFWGARVDRQWWEFDDGKSVHNKGALKINAI